MLLRRLASSAPSGSSRSRISGSTTRRASERDALLLPARQSLGLEVADVGQAEFFEDALDLGVALGGRHLLDVKTEANIRAHGHVRKQRVILKDHRRRPALRRHVVDPVAANEDVARRDRLESRDHPQRRRLAAAGWSEKRDELAFRNLEIEVDDRRRTVIIDLPDTGELQIDGHASVPDIAVIIGSLSRARRRGSARTRSGRFETRHQSGAEEFVPLLHQVVVLIRPLMPVGDGRGALLERAAVSQIAFLDAALRRALPRLALVPEGVFVGRH